MRFDILTLFPDIIYHYCSESILKRAQKAGLIDVHAYNFRDYTADKHNRVDDAPYGGGAGMVLQVQPIYECLRAIGALSSRAKRSVVEGSLGCHSRESGNPVGDCLDPRLHGDDNCERDSSAQSLRSLGRNDKLKIIALDPAGKKFDQRMAERFAKLDRLILICGRYQGFDERVYKFVDEKVSVGDYVLSGGELSALAIVEAVSRLIPGVLGNTESLDNETFNKSKYQISNFKSMSKSKCQKLEIGNWKLKIAAEPPQYTRPENFMGLKVPKVLLSGDHKKIEEWRRKHRK